ncbi:MAG: MutS-related protein [Bryobacteraceae bacterium]
MQASGDPQAEYARRLQERSAVANELDRRARLIGNARFLVGICAAILAFFVFGRVSISPFWLILPVILFVVLAVWHSRVFSSLGRARRSITFYDKGLARLQDRWPGAGEQGNRYRDPSHVYAEDLDLFGSGSLYELLCTARTRAGEDLLAHWLLSPAAPSEVLERQTAISETRANVGLREEFTLAGEDFRSEFHPASLTQWVKRPPARFPLGTRFAAALVTGATLLTFTLYMASILTRTPFLACLLIDLAFGFALRSRVSAVVDSVESPARDLALAAAMLQLIEQRQFQAPMLQRLRRELETEGLAASAHIANLERLVDRLDWQHNLFFAPIAAVLQWSTHLSIAVEKWRAQWGGEVRRWLDVIAEWEALGALATYSFEHPTDPFPELAQGGSCFQAEQVAHPLMPGSKCVPNDVSLGGPLQLLIVSGSNMSGKSTLLRSVGLNTVLAWAGAPVRAKRLRISPLQVGASIRVLDSLQDGRSRFYAEITRLRQILDLTAGERTVLFLIDELLSGTNSHDRRIGAEAIVKGLVERGAAGIITTHDLALVHIADDLGGGARNLHFADVLENGALRFDYQLHEGVVQRSNALELMRSVGLPL